MKLLLLTCALSLSSCVPPVFPEDNIPIYEERPVYGHFNSDFTTVWESALQVMSDHYPISHVDKDRGSILTEWNLGTSDYVYNVFSGTKIPERVRFRIRMDVRNRSGKIEVRLLLHEQMEKDVISANLEFTGAIYEWIDIPSSTLRERQVLREMLDIIEGRVQEDLDFLE